MFATLKKVISDKLLKNHKLIPTSPLDVRELSDDPRLLNYIGPQRILINAKLEKGRVFNFMPLSTEGNPFVSALVNSSIADNTKKKKSSIKDTIRTYYDNNQPKNIYDWYGLPQPTSSKLTDIPAWSAPMPWSGKSITSEKKSVEHWLAQDNALSGSDLKIDRGFTYYGPVSEKKLEIETNRLLSIYQSIKSNGYIRSDEQDGDIGVEVFISNCEEKIWRVFRGQHRSIALSALGYTKVPVQVKMIIRAGEVDCWPNVLSGLYTKDQAVELFHAVCSGTTDHLTL